MIAPRAKGGSALQILLGKTQNRDFFADADVLRRSHLLMTGVSGSGKSYRLRVFAEMLFPMMPVLIFDPEGEYYTLREKFSFLLFGENGDAPMSVSTAGLLAQKILEWRKSAIFDLSGLEVAEQHQWMQIFLDSLMSAPRELWSPFAMLMDEAHLWAPEKGEATSLALQSVKNLCARGRKRGFFVCLATQRLSRLSNSCASETQNYLIGRTTLQADRDRAAKILGVTNKQDKDQFFREIKNLHDHFFYGQGIAISPDRVLISPVEAQTTHIRPGDIQDASPARPEEIQAFMPQLSAIESEAKEKLNTEEQLRARVQTLTRQLEEMRATTVNPLKIAQMEEVVSNFQEQAGSYSANLNNFFNQVRKLAELPDNQVRYLKPEEVFHPVVDTLRNEGVLTPSLPIVFHPNVPEDFDKNWIRVIGVLKGALSRGMTEIPRNWLAIGTGLSPTSSGYRMHISKMNVAGWIGFPSRGNVSLTLAGMELTIQETNLTKELLVNNLRKLFEPASFRILQVLIELDDWLDRESLAERTEQSVTSSAYRRHISRLRKLGFLEVGQNSTVRIDPWIYLERR